MSDGTLNQAALEVACMVYAAPKTSAGVPWNKLQNAGLVHMPLPTTKDDIREDIANTIKAYMAALPSEIPVVADTDCPECAYLKMRKLCLAQMLNPDEILNKPPKREISKRTLRDEFLERPDIVELWEGFKTDNGQFGEGA